MLLKHFGDFPAINGFCFQEVVPITHLKTPCIIWTPQNTGISPAGKWQLLEATAGSLTLFGAGGLNPPLAHFYITYLINSCSSTFPI